MGDFCPPESSQIHSLIGTGKSETGAHLAYALIKSSSSVQSTPDGKIRCVMYCGPSNKSVNVVLGKCAIQFVYINQFTWTLQIFIGNLCIK